MTLQKGHWEEINISDHTLLTSISFWCLLSINPPRILLILPIQICFLGPSSVRMQGNGSQGAKEDTEHALDGGDRVPSQEPARVLPTLQQMQESHGGLVKYRFLGPTYHRRPAILIQWVQSEVGKLAFLTHSQCCLCCFSTDHILCGTGLTF